MALLRMSQTRARRPNVYSLKLLVMQTSCGNNFYFSSGSVERSHGRLRSNWIYAALESRRKPQAFRADLSPNSLLHITPAESPSFPETKSAVCCVLNICSDFCGAMTL